MQKLNQHANSGNIIKIVDINEKPFILKIFRKDLTKYKKCVEKQAHCETIKIDRLLRVYPAQIFSIKYSKKSIHLTMPFVDGIVGSEYGIYASTNSFHRLCLGIDAFIKKNLIKSQVHEIHKSVISLKLNQIINNTKNLKLRKILKDVQLLLKELPEKVEYPIGPYHGDLTLSNIIYDKNKNICLIDFLDSFIDSPLQDIAKLKQDFDFYYSFRYCSNNIKLKSQILMNALRPGIIKLSEKKWPLQIKILTIMTLARIAPYVKDEITLNWLISSIEKQKREFNKL